MANRVFPLVRAIYATLLRRRECCRRSVSAPDPRLNAGEAPHECLGGQVRALTGAARPSVKLVPDDVCALIDTNEAPAAAKDIIDEAFSSS